MMRKPFYLCGAHSSKPNPSNSHEKIFYKFQMRGINTQNQKVIKNKEHVRTVSQEMTKEAYNLV